MKNKVLPIVILTALLATVVTFVVLLNVEKNMLNDYERGLVWVLKKEMPEGNECNEENLEKFFEQIWVNKGYIPERAVESLDDLRGMRSRIVLSKGTIITCDMFTGEQSVLEEMESPVIAGCKAEDLYQMVSGTLRKGDRINLYTVDEELEETHLLWENVLVYEVFDSTGINIASTDRETAAARINILLEAEFAEMFYTELYRGSLRVVKVS